MLMPKARNGSPSAKQKELVIRVYDNHVLCRLTIVTKRMGDIGPALTIGYLFPRLASAKPQSRLFYKPNVYILSISTCLGKPIKIINL